MRKDIPSRGSRARHRPARPLLLISLIAVLGFAGFVTYAAVARFPRSGSAFAGLAAIDIVSGPVTHISDGDTLEVAHVPIQLASLDCAERGTSEGRLATTALTRLVAATELTCRQNGRTSYDRRIGSCALPNGRDVASIMIEEGLCQRS